VCVLFFRPPNVIFVVIIPRAKIRNVIVFCDFLKNSPNANTQQLHVPHHHKEQPSTFP
jgi:hypothetical protein